MVGFLAVEKRGVFLWGIKAVQYVLVMLWLWAAYSNGSLWSPTATIVNTLILVSLWLDFCIRLAPLLQKWVASRMGIGIVKSGGQAAASDGGGDFFRCRPPKDRPIAGETRHSGAHTSH